jgi:ABC-type Co2+ transport system permease subunit
MKIPLLRALLVAGGTLVGLLGTLLLVVAIATNRWDQLSAVDLSRALQLVRSPSTLAAAGLVALLVAWAEYRWHTAPEFALGMLVGAFAVIATVALNALVLLVGGSEDWHQIVSVVILAHLPLVPIEGVIVGFTVTFLMRVRPELVDSGGQTKAWLKAEDVMSDEPVAAPVKSHLAARPPVLVLAITALMLTAGPARAHRLRAEYKCPRRRAHTGGELV